MITTRAGHPLPKECTCAIHDGPHWLYMDRFDRERMAPLWRSAREGSKLAILALAQEEPARLREKRENFARLGIVAACGECWTGFTAAAWDALGDERRCVCGRSLAADPGAVSRGFDALRKTLEAPPREVESTPEPLALAAPEPRPKRAPRPAKPAPLPCAVERAAWRAALDLVREAERCLGFFSRETNAVVEVVIAADARLHEAMARGGAWLPAEPIERRCRLRSCGATPQHECRLARDHAGDHENELGQAFGRGPYEAQS